MVSRLLQISNRSDVSRSFSRLSAPRVILVLGNVSWMLADRICWIGLLVPMMDNDIEWARGACRGLPLSVFFPNHAISLGKDLARARAICSRCPIRVQCRDHGRVNEGYGIWGGVSMEGNAHLHAHMHWYSGSGICVACQQSTSGPIKVDPITNYIYCQECAT